MASYEPDDRFDPLGPPPRPTTPAVRRGFLVVLGFLGMLTLLVYGIPYVAERTGYAYEAGRSRAAADALKRLDAAGIIDKSSALFRMAVVKVAPAVVNIRNWRYAPGAEGRGLPFGGGGGLLGRGLIPVGSGSGVVIDKRHGYIVTNHHVVKDADELIVRMGRGSEYRAKLVGADPKTDLAVLKVDAQLPADAPWADSDKADIGDWVLAIGSPFLLDQTVTAGIISATGRNNLPILERDTYQDFIQTDAAVNPGNSGGPLINLRGEIVGINTAIFSPIQTESGEGGNVGIGLAISSNMAKRIVEQLIQNGRVVRGYLGVSISDVNTALAKQLGLPEPAGALIARVEADSPAAKAGLQPGDVVIGLDGREVPDSATFRTRIATLPAGTQVELTYYREGKKDKLQATIGEFPILLTLGLSLRDLSGEAADRLPGSPERAVIIEEVVPNSRADQVGLRPGMRIVAVNGRPVATKAEANAIADALPPDAGVPLRIQLRDGREADVLVGGPPPRRRRR